MLGQVHKAFQILFGIVLIVWVAMGVLGWAPPQVLPEARPFRDAIFASGYVIPVVLVVYGIAGVAFISNRFVPLASILLAPVSINIALFHAVLNPTVRSLAIAFTLMLANGYMLYHCRRAYKALLEPGYVGK